jgi:hypothetical protein
MRATRIIYLYNLLPLTQYWERGRGVRAEQKS